MGTVSQVNARLDGLGMRPQDFKTLHLARHIRRIYEWGTSPDDLDDEEFKALAWQWARRR